MKVYTSSEDPLYVVEVGPDTTYEPLVTVISCTTPAGKATEKETLFKVASVSGAPLRGGIPNPGAWPSTLSSVQKPNRVRCTSPSGHPIVSQAVIAAHEAEKPYWGREAA